MKNYCVTIPITGHVDITCAYEGKPSDDVLYGAAIDQWDKMSERQRIHATTWEFTQRTGTGNVSHCECNEMSWDETEGEIDEAKPPTKAQLWRKVARLMGELAFGLEQDTLVDRNGVVKAVPLARALIRAGQQNRKTKRLAAKLEAALKAWEAA